MQHFYLTKEFEEIDGLDLVVVHWSVTRRGRAPKWRDSRSVALQAVQHDGRWIRRATLDVALDGDGPWTLHHFHRWIRWGVPQSGPAYAEEIAAREIEHIDQIGEFSAATLVYNIGEHGWTNVVAMQVAPHSDGLADAACGAATADIVSPEWPEEPGRSVIEWQRRAAAAIQAGPRRFHARVFAPAGARVLYSIHLARLDGLNPMADSGIWVARREVVI